MAIIREILRASTFVFAFFFVTLVADVNVTMRADNVTMQADNVTTTTMTTDVKNSNATATTKSDVLMCRIDDSIDFRANPDNVYECRGDDEKCCMEAGLPSCCVNRSIEEEIHEQAILWGSVLGVLMVIGLVVCCCCRDFNCCEGDEDCAHYMTCGCCRRNSAEEYRKLSRLSLSSTANSAKPPCDSETGSDLEEKVKTAPVSLSVQDLQAVQAERLTDTLMADYPFV